MDHSVIYFSATGLFDTLSKYKFDYRNSDDLRSSYGDLFESDLLIIDDLGTEFTNNMIASELFSLIKTDTCVKKLLLYPLIFHWRISGTDILTGSFPESPATTKSVR